MFVQITLSFLIRYFSVAKGWIEVSNSLGGAAIADLGGLNTRQLQVPADVPQAKHKRLYSLQTLRQLDINTDQ